MSLVKLMLRGKKLCVLTEISLNKATQGFLMVLTFLTRARQLDIMSG